MKALALYNLYVTRAVAVAAGVCAIAAFLYGAFLLLAVSHAAGISITQEKVRTLTATLSEREATYLAQTRDLTPQVATTLGYVKPSAVTVVYAAVPSALSVNR